MVKKMDNDLYNNYGLRLRGTSTKAVIKYCGVLEIRVGSSVSLLAVIVHSTRLKIME